MEPEEGLASLCSTNRVWFERRVAADAWDNVALADVPPGVFSEAMRDVDLITAVAAIGPDPDWMDHPNLHADGRPQDQGRVHPQADPRKPVKGRDSGGAGPG
ncbi:hypothetical protein [Arthrobacter globiformis]|uniref:hypothetical protein n=1 Tax=Arthrobacter globiformis TaxID=1665 RepID=UPI000B40DEE4|nr:hypothetical protein [Arthrobacter globiformis]